MVNIANANTWPNADVYIGTLVAANPVGVAAFGAGWTAVGLLQGSDGFAQGRSSDSNDFFGWGGYLIEVTDKNYKETQKFTALEDNAVIQALINPGSALTFAGTVGGITLGADDYSGTIKVPVKAKFKIGFEARTPTRVWRRITKNYATLDGYPPVVAKEDGLGALEITVAIFPDSSAILYDAYKGPAS